MDVNTVIAGIARKFSSKYCIKRLSYINSIIGFKDEIKCFEIVMSSELKVCSVIFFVDIDQEILDYIKFYLKPNYKIEKIVKENKINYIFFNYS